MVAVQFRYLTGLKRQIFSNAVLKGSWDGSGVYSQAWTETPMTPGIAEDGCPCFAATVQLDAGGVGSQFEWGVVLDGPSGAGVWGITTEVNDPNATNRYRAFTLAADGASARQDFYFTYARRLGARKYFTDPTAAPDLKFAVWAPNALAINVVFGKPNGYIADDGDGIDATTSAIPLQPAENGIWESAVLPIFNVFEGMPYMYRIKNAQGNPTYRTDLYSRYQLGSGGFDPCGAHFSGDPSTLDGTKSCSVIVSLDTVAAVFGAPEGVRVPEADFWKDEFTSGRPVPRQLSELVIYELHVNALGGPDPAAPPGTFLEALDLLPYLYDLGVNAIELLPISQFSGGAGWGYGDSHLFVIESSAGRRDEFKYFVRECHRHGIAVIQDVCYNHWDWNAERAESLYDSTAPEQNIYYWYQGVPANYADPSGGYVDNGSTGWAPRYWEEMVRQLFASSAAAFVEEFHIDGLRVDLTQAIHRDNTLHADKSSVGNANLYGMKMLREWTRTLHLIRPSVMLIAEDHTGWAAVTQPPDAGGLGFDATWFAEFYHSLIGDSDMAGGDSRLLKTAGQGGDGPLAMGQFAGVLYNTQYNKVVYSESHDEAGNSGGTQRTIVCAVNGAPLFGPTRDAAEARCRACFGLSLLSAGTPMFFMGEEIGAQKMFIWNTFMANREDLAGGRAGDGARLFAFYQDAIKLSRAHPAARSQQIDILHASDANRVIAFTRSAGAEMLLVVASLANQPYLDGYVIQTDPARLPDGAWREIFNSDAAGYGGAGIGNFGADIPVSGGTFQARVPTSGFLVFQKL